VYFLPQNAFGCRLCPYTLRELTALPRLLAVLGEKEGERHGREGLGGKRMEWKSEGERREAYGRMTPLPLAKSFRMLRPCVFARQRRTIKIIRLA